MIPSNCHFEVDDSELDWIYPEDWFDLIHIRNIAQGISDWPKLLAQAYRTVKPGGYVELGELSGSLHADDDSMPDTHPTKIAFDLFETAMEQSGRPKVAWEVMEANMKEAGFVDIMVVSKKQPFGPWPRDPILKKVGAMVLMMMHTGVEAYGMMLFTKVLGMEVDEARKVCTDCLSGIKQKNSHLYNYLWVLPQPISMSMRRQAKYVAATLFTDGSQNKQPAPLQQVFTGQTERSDLQIAAMVIRAGRIMNRAKG